MEYDEIDQYVEKLFSQGDGDGKPSSGKPSGEWHVGNVDEVIQDTYNKALWWHNNRISEGGDPRSGLRGLPYVPWDENIDGMAAMQGAVGGLSDSSYARNGAPAAHPQPETGGRGLIIFALLGLMLTCMWAVCYSSGVTLEMAP